MAMLRVREGVMLLMEKSDMAILKLRKYVVLLWERSDWLY